MATIIRGASAKTTWVVGETKPVEQAGTGLALRHDMQHAAKATLSEADAPAQADSGFSAFLRLRQGSSARATWVLEEWPGGTMISVGADVACDWQLRAAFVPARAFSILVVGGRTFVRSGPEPGVLLNGKPLDDGWVQVPGGARIDVGLARLEVTMGYGDWASGSPAQGESAQPASAEPAQVDEAVHELRTRKPPRESAATQARQTKRNATIELTLDDLDYMGTRVGALPRERRNHDVSGEFEVSAAAAEEDAPSLLGGRAPRDMSKLRRYALAGLVTVSAYGGWVLLLDYL